MWLVDTSVGIDQGRHLNLLHLAYPILNLDGLQDGAVHGLDGVLVDDTPDGATESTHSARIIL